MLNIFSITGSTFTAVWKNGIPQEDTESGGKYKFKGDSIIQIGTAISHIITHSMFSKLKKKAELCKMLYDNQQNIHVM